MIERSSIETGQNHQAQVQSIFINFRSNKNKLSRAQFVIATAVCCSIVSTLPRIKTNEKISAWENSHSFTHVSSDRKVLFWVSVSTFPVAKGRLMHFLPIIIFKFPAHLSATNRVVSNCLPPSLSSTFNELQIFFSCHQQKPFRVPKLEWEFPFTTCFVCLFIWIA